MLQCPECGLPLSTSEAVDQHRAKSHEVPIFSADPLPCPDCERTYKNLNALTRHREMHHGYTAPASSGHKYETYEYTPRTDNEAGDSSDYHDGYSYGSELAEPTGLDYVRLAIGLVSRFVMWAAVLFIVGNAVGEAISRDAWVGAFLEAVFFPLTFFLYPFLAPADAMAWPLADGTSFIPALIVGVVAYPISTFIGGLDIV